MTPGYHVALLLMLLGFYIVNGLTMGQSLGEKSKKIIMK